MKEGSIATWQTTLSATSQTVVGGEYSGLTSTQSSKHRISRGIKPGRRPGWKPRLVCMRDQCGKMALIDHVPKHSHTLSFHSKTLQNSNKLGYIRIKLEQTVSKTSWLWSYCCRKGAKRPDLQQCKLTVKEESRATWHTICKLTMALLL